MTAPLEIPADQDTFKLNEVCKLANVQPYMLRFWGTEFPQLEATKSGTGQRLYSRDQVELIFEIRRLLFDEGLTIAGARKRVNAGVDAAPAKAETKVEAKATKPEKKAETEAPARKAVTKTRPAARTRQKKPSAAPAQVDKGERERVQRLRSTLTRVRDELAGILATFDSKQ